MRFVIVAVLLAGCAFEEEPMTVGNTWWGSSPAQSKYSAGIFTQSYAQATDGGWQISTFQGDESVPCSEVVGTNHGGMTVWISNAALAAGGDVAVGDPFDPSVAMATMQFSGERPQSGTLKLLGDPLDRGIGSVIVGEFAGLVLAGPGVMVRGELAAVRCD